MSRFMRGDSRGDFWLMNGRYNDGVSTEADAATYSGGFLKEAKRRPEICRAMVHAMRWSGADPASAKNLLTHLQNSIEQPWRKKEDGTDQFRWPTERAMLIYHLCWCTRRLELSQDLTPENWSDIYDRWKAWYGENAPYLRFDAQTDQYFIDEEAKRSERPVPPESQLARPTDTPLPGWTGSVAQ